MQRRVGFRLVALCYDLIPLLFPHWYESADVAVFRHHWATLFPICQTVLITSAAVERDVKAHCDEYGIKTSLTRVPLGYNPPADLDDAPLPAGLEPGRFALFVATLEPRKGHAVLVAAWRILLARGLPQRQQFRLVFVGRAGWKVGALLQDLTDPALDGTLIHLPSIDDAGLATLYQQAAFCVYPSLYEGFGLPLVESFAYGKPVIASTGGSVPEIAATFCPCLDPQDVDAWAEAIARWITNPEEPAAIAARLRNEFRHPNWAEAANLILLAARP
jgi:glycosyltransferase involved in cell wall biosynthesis